MNETVGAQHVVSRLMRESLIDKKLIAGTESAVRAILPALNVVQIGGLQISQIAALGAFYVAIFAFVVLARRPAPTAR